MARAKKKDMFDTAAGEAVRAFADAAVAVAKLRNDIPDRELVDGIAKDGSTRGDGLVVVSAEDFKGNPGLVHPLEIDSQGYFSNFRADNMGKFFMGRIR